MFRAVVVGVAVVATTIGALAGSADAPADEYFGPFKYSPLSMRSKITALGRSYRERWADDASLVHDALMVESSYMVWAQRYPNDRWLAPTAYHLAQLYQVIQTQDARNHARAMYQYVVKTFPKSKEAHAARLRLQQGFPPLHDEPPVSPTPSPYGTPAVPGASGAPASSPSPATAASPAASAGPVPASPGVAPSTRPTAGPAASTAPRPAAASPAPSASPRG